MKQNKHIVSLRGAVADDVAVMVVVKVLVDVGFDVVVGVCEVDVAIVVVVETVVVDVVIVVVEEEVVGVIVVFGP